MFVKHTASQTAGRYRPLILDGHSSHASFDCFCTARKIVPATLDISCFAPLKHYYGQQMREMTQKDIHAIDKMGFLSIYTNIHRTFSKANILSGFAAAGLIPFKPERVLAKLRINVKTNTIFFKQQSILLLRENTCQSLPVESTEKADSSFKISLYLQ